jgi:hypothetical protein
MDFSEVILSNAFSETKISFFIFSLSTEGRHEAIITKTARLIKKAKLPGNLAAIFCYFFQDKNIKCFCATIELKNDKFRIFHVTSATKLYLTTIKGTGNAKTAKRVAYIFNY